MTALSLSVVGAAIFLSSFISGVFGIAGGMILLGALLVFFDVPTAMVLFSLLAATGNIWRVVMWRRYIDWRIWFQYMIGAVLAFSVLRFIAFVPSKPLVYLLLGLMPWMVEVLPRRWHPNIQWRGIPVFTGLATTGIQLVAGNGGMFLDVFFQKSEIDRRTTVATKAVCHSVGNLLRIFYFGTIADVSDALPLWFFGLAILLAIAGTMFAPVVLNRMTDHSFRRWTRKLIFLVSSVYLVRAAWLYWRD
ncbi:MAG: sulfite exporter TauE/SafE family protein [Xanthobacteraceae bacterium]